MKKTNNKKKASPLIITTHGTRGTRTMSGNEFSKYGHKTPCVSFEKEWKGETHRIIIDAGSGIINYGQKLMSKQQNKQHFYIFFTHYHFDHIEGLPFFDPLYFSQNTIHFHGLSHHEKTLKEFFDIDKWQINQPILISEIYNTIGAVTGVQSVPNVEVRNMAGAELGYSVYKYDIKDATIKGIIYPSLDPSIFEVLDPNTDIKGKVTQY